MPESNYYFLYHSQLAEDSGVDAVPAIVKTARIFNSSHGISGVLVFDGMRFCQYFEGPEDAVNTLIAKLQRDHRHAAFTPMAHAPLEGARRFQSWAMAYAYIDEGDPLATLVELQGHDALQHLLQVSGELDLA